MNKVIETYFYLSNVSFTPLDFPKLEWLHTKNGPTDSKKETYLFPTMLDHIVKILFTYTLSHFLGQNDFRCFKTVLITWSARQFLGKSVKFLPQSPILMYSLNRSHIQKYPLGECSLAPYKSWLLHFISHYLFGTQIKSLHTAFNN